MDSSVVLYRNKCGALRFQQTDHMAILHTQLNCTILKKDEGMAILAAMEAFYSMNDQAFLQVFDLNCEYIPDPDLILATMNLMRKSAAHFERYLIQTAIVAYDHASTCQRYLSRFTTTRPVVFVSAYDDIQELSMPEHTKTPSTTSLASGIDEPCSQSSMQT